MKALDIDFDFFNRILYYQDGDLYWKIRMGKRGKPGTRAGTIDPFGYLLVQTGGKRYRSHRIIWALHYGSISSTQQIDHIDGNRLNNKIENLRLCNGAENSQNKGLIKSNTSGLKGVSYSTRDEVWQADIQVNRKKIYLGSFHSKEAAYEVYKNAALELHGEFANIPQTA